MIIGVFGKPGSGKTTYLASICVKARFKRWLQRTLPAWLARFIKMGDIYSTEPMSGTILIDPYDIGTFCPPPYSIFLIHEAGCSFNNRSFKSIPKHCTDFFAQHRHYLCDIYYDSQTVDIDKKLRNRTECFYVVTKSMLFRHNSVLTRVSYWIGVNSDSKQLDECYSMPDGFFQNLLARLFFRRITLHRRFYYRFFNSHIQSLNLPNPPPTVYTP